MTNFFTLYNEPYHLQINKSVLQKKFYELSKLYHPDKAKDLPNTEVIDGLPISEAVNMGYQILINMEKRIAYLFNTLCIINAEDKLSLSNEFLLEMMDLNEEIMEAKMDNSNNEAVKIKIANKCNETANSVSWVWLMDDVSTCTNEQKLLLKKFYYENKYCLRLQNLLTGNSVEM